MATIEIKDHRGKLQKVHVCDYCKTVCIPWPSRYCSGRCAGQAREAAQFRINAAKQSALPAELPRLSDAVEVAT